MLRTLLLTLALVLNNAASVYALDSTSLQFELQPLGCITDTVDDGLNIYQYDSSPLCTPPEPTETPSTAPVDTVPDIVTYLPKKSTNNNVLTKSPDTGNLNVQYHAALSGKIVRQSVVHKLVAVVGTMTTLSLILLFLRSL